jgi:4-hydroxybenzoate polyprenyltransferase
MTAADGRVADAVRGSWVDVYAPAGWRPYLRLARADRPIGSWLLLLPCWWSAAFAAIAAGQPLPNLWHMLLFAIGAVAMRGAGCTYNDIVDEDIDSQVERTRSRPLPSGQVTRRQAKTFLVLQALAGLGVLAPVQRLRRASRRRLARGRCDLPIHEAHHQLAAVRSGLAFSWGALMGWAAVFADVDAPAMLLYCGSILWVIGYDTIYAHQDKEDDAIVGVRSTALLFGERTPLFLSLFYGAAVAVFAASLWSLGAPPLAYVGLAAFAAHLVWQVRTLDIADPDR